MDLQPTVDQIDMVQTVESWLTKELTRSHVHERLRAGTPVDVTAWPRAAAVGLFSLGLPEESGGAGCPVVEEALVVRSLGHHLAPVSFLGSLLGARVAEAVGASEIRDAVAEGRSRVALALGGLGHPPFGDAGTVDVVDLPGADFVLSVGDGGTVLQGVAGAGVDGPVEDLDCIDPSATLHRLPARQLDGGLRASDERLPLLARLLTAAMLTGVAECARDAAVEHATVRVQFGRPIGVHQAVKHPVADMAVRCEAASSLLSLAALALRDGRPDAVFQVAAAKRTAATAALENARANVQVHGGMGVTWENDAHLLLTRARLLDQLFGTRHELRAAMLRHAPAMP